MYIDNIPTAVTVVQFHAFDSLIDYFRVSTFIELGTSHGGLASHFMKRQTGEKEARYYDPPFHYYGFEINSGVVYSQVRDYITIADVTHSTTMGRIKGIIDSSVGPVIIFCDTNNKPREMLIYAEFLRVMDIIIGHDYPGEITDKFLDDYGKEHPNFQEIGGRTYRSQGYSAWIRIE